MLRSSGMPIPAIRRYTELACGGDTTAADRLALLREHRALALVRIAALHRCLDLVNHKVAVYEDYLGDPAAGPA
ncbi:hypothetical protein ABZW30_44510 [Kitasatospora sp. NPDC004669]|uniref:hypothetical protein n=1 Tax=Kitasatospora sp. NPDC004669 TaxID=3154555 RepID=UPI0033A8F4A5